MMRRWLTVGLGLPFDESVDWVTNEGVEFVQLLLAARDDEVLGVLTTDLGSK
ncbi:hypothetical protein ACFFQF_16275 [Haladaptatus pallidirubidus]|nr:hypothetical protein [Haladaptatus pallidirubidus]